VRVANTNNFGTGAGESGKSTVLKQMKLIYAQGFTKNERLEGKPVVFNNVVQSLRLIFDVMNDQSIDFGNKDNEVRGKSTYCAAVGYVHELFPSCRINLRCTLFKLWPAGY
jgi:hypothetical protein